MLFLGVCGGIGTRGGQRSVLGIVIQMWSILLYDAGFLIGLERATWARLIGQQGKTSLCLSSAGIASTSGHTQFFHIDSKGLTYILMFAWQTLMAGLSLQSHSLIHFSTTEIFWKYSMVEMFHKFNS